MSVLGCLTESNASEMIHTEETNIFSRFEPFQIPEEMGIDVAFQKTRIWKTRQKLIRLVELLWLWTLLFSRLIYEDIVVRKILGQRQLSN